MTVRDVAALVFILGVIVLGLSVLAQDLFFISLGLILAIIGGCWRASIEMSPWK